MKYFKDNQNKVHALEDAAFAHLLPDGCIEITEQEAIELQKPPPETPEQAVERLKREAEAQAVADAKADEVVQYLANHTPLECYQYVQDNVSDLVSAKVVMGKFAAVLSIVSRRL